MRSDKLAQILDLARDQQLLVFSDEVYRGLEYNAADRLPAACDRYENAVSLGVMSKTYGLAGLRIGWIVTRNREVYRRMSAMKDYLSICNSAPSEFLAAVALRASRSNRPAKPGDHSAQPWLSSTAFLPGIKRCSTGCAPKRDRWRFPASTRRQKPFAWTWSSGRACCCCQAPALMRAIRTSESGSGVKKPAGRDPEIGQLSRRIPERHLMTTPRTPIPPYRGGCRWNPDRRRSRNQPPCQAGNPRSAAARRSVYAVYRAAHVRHPALHRRITLKDFTLWMRARRS